MITSLKQRNSVSQTSGRLIVREVHAEVQLSSALPAAHLGYILARKSTQQGCRRVGEHRKHVRTVVPETPALARPCPAHGGWTPLKGFSLR